MSEYWLLPEAARNTGIPVQLLKQSCECAQIAGAIRFGRVWFLPPCAEALRQQCIQFCQSMDYPVRHMTCA